MGFMHSLLELLHLVLLLLHSRFKLFLRLALPKMEKALKKKRLTGATGADINANLVVQGLLQHLNRVALLVHVLLCVSCVRWPNPLCVCVCVCVVILGQAHVLPDERHICHSTWCAAAFSSWARRVSAASSASSARFRQCASCM